MNPSGWLPGITDAALAHPKEYARGSIGTTEREGYRLDTLSEINLEQAATARRLELDGLVWSLRHKMR